MLTILIMLFVAFKCDLSFFHINVHSNEKFYYFHINKNIRLTVHQIKNGNPFKNQTTKTQTGE